MNTYARRAARFLALWAVLLVLGFLTALLPGWAYWLTFSVSTLTALVLIRQDARTAPRPGDTERGTT